MVGDVEYLRKAIAESKAIEMEARREQSRLQIALNHMEAERDHAERSVRDLQHELDLAHRLIAELRSK